MYMANYTTNLHPLFNDPVPKDSPFKTVFKTLDLENLTLLVVS